MKIYVGDIVKFELDCKEDVDGQSDLWILYKKPISKDIGRWEAIGIGDLATYTSIKDVDIDEKGTWVVMPYSDVYDVHGDEAEMPVFPPLIPFQESVQKVFLEGTE